MEPLSKEEIDKLEASMSYFIDVSHPRLARLFFTARLGAAYEQATKQKAGQP